MNEQNTFCIVITTTGNEKEADNLARKIISAKLGACVQVQPMKSYYFWNDELCSDSECCLLIKTRSVLYDKLEAFIKTNHSYEVPEIIQIPIEKGLPSYLNWITNITN